MGTSKESKRSTDEEDGEVIIPFDVVPYTVRRELIKKLNPDATVLGNDWRMLASELGYTTGEITYIESEKDNNTAVLFRQYDTKPGASLNNVYRALEKMKRKDCQDIIRNAMPEIHQAYIKANEAQTLRAAQTSEMLSAREHYQWPGSPCSCPYTQQHPPTSPYGSHPYYPCSHSYSNCGGACHGHHLGSFPSPYQTHLPQPHPSMCQTYSHSETVLKTCEPSFSSPCSTTLAAHGYLMSPQPNCRNNSVGQPLGSSSPRCQENSQNASHNTQKKQHSSRHGHSGLSPGHTGGYRGSPTYNHNQNDGLMTDSELRNLKYRKPNNSGMMISDQPTAFSESFLRLQVNNMPLPNNIIVFDDSSPLSSDSSNSDSLNTRQKVARQYSDECNVTQISRGDKRFRNNNSRENLGSEGSIDQCCAALQEVKGHTASSGFKLRNGHSPKLVHPSDSAGYTDWRERCQQRDYEMKVRNGPGELVSNQVAYGESKTSLALLEKLANVPDKFKPTKEYKTVVAEQKIEVDKRRKEGKVSTPSSSSQSSNGSPLGLSHSSTFPLNMKVQHDPDMDELKNLTITKMPTSVPPNLTSQEYKKTFGHIKVFVTYSCDNRSHGNQVLSLCKFLQTNGFACCVDVREKQTTARSLEQLEWCRRKVLEADFVLVCISRKYLEDISSASSSFLSEKNERQLHTREIYELMNSEYLNNQHTYGDESNIYTPPHRFVPLLFDNMTYNRVPPWMMNGPAYVWPDQYKDLAWMLTKPQERIMGRREVLREQLEEIEQRGSDLDVAAGMDMTNLMSSVLCSS